MVIDGYQERAITSDDNFPHVQPRIFIQNNIYTETNNLQKNEENHDLSYMEEQYLPGEHNNERIDRERKKTRIKKLPYISS